PRSSQCPSISSSWLAFCFSHAALASRVLASPGRITALSKSKKTGFTASFGLNSLGGGGGRAGAGLGGGARAGRAPRARAAGERAHGALGPEREPGAAAAAA